VAKAHDGEENREKLAGDGQRDEHDRGKGAHDVEDEALPDRVREAKQQKVQPHLEGEKTPI
jgi:hypothetical protein